MAKRFQMGSEPGPDAGPGSLPSPVCEPTRGPQMKAVDRGALNREAEASSLWLR